MSKAIPGHLIRKITVALRDSPFLDSESLGSLFKIDERISPWQADINLTIGQPNRLILHLMEKLFDKNHALYNGRNALALFLEVLADRLSDDDKARMDLINLKNEWLDYLNERKREEEKTNELQAQASLNKEQFDIFLETIKHFIKDQLLQELREAQQSSRTSFEETELQDAVYTYLSKGYGFGYDTLDIVVSIGADGSATITRRIYVQAHTEIKNLAIYLLSPEGDTLTQDIEITSLSEHNLELIQHIPEMKQKKRITSLQIVPALHSGENAKFELVEFVKSKTFAINLSKEQLLAREVADEYVGWNITRPTKRMTITVNFPPEFLGYSIEPDSVTVYALSTGDASELEQLEEKKRIEMSKDFNNNHQIFMGIDYPVVGLVYKMKWRPKASDE